MLVTVLVTIWGQRSVALIATFARHVDDFTMDFCVLPGWKTVIRSYGQRGAMAWR